jgi:hypothetical protein
MKKLIVFSVFLVFAGYASAQKYSSKTGKVTLKPQYRYLMIFMLRMITIWW